MDITTFHSIVHTAVVFGVYFSITLLISLSGLYMVQRYQQRHTMHYLGLKAEWLFWLVFLFIVTQVDIYSYNLSSLVAGLIYAFIRAYTVVTALLHGDDTSLDRLTVSDKRYEKLIKRECKDN
jgi:hypothetical protein